MDLESVCSGLKRNEKPAEWRLFFSQSSKRCGFRRQLNQNKACHLGDKQGVVW